MNIFTNEGPILHQDAMSFHLSHQPPLYVSIYFLLHELVQLVLILLHKIKSTRTQVVDGSNESLEHADEDLDTLLQKYSPLQKIFKKSSVQLDISQKVTCQTVASWTFTFRFLNSRTFAFQRFSCWTFETVFAWFE